MSGPTVRFKVRFGNEPAVQTLLPAPVPGPEPVLPAGHASRTARLLAIAHRMDALLRDGSLRDYEHAAAWLGVSKVRANVIAHLVFLAPDIQEAILLGDTAASELRLREVAREPMWSEQRRLLRG